MNDIINDTLGWWIAVVEIPVLSALFWLIHHYRRDAAQENRALAAELAEHRLEVARHYARALDLRVLEGRITSHLLRIEAKLDVTALKAEALHAEKRN